MKREAWGHRKYRKLAQILGVDESWAVGIVESLWRATDQELPTGNIGKLSNADIALAMRCGYNPDRLVAGLTEAGWIDPHPNHRLIVHDWPDHCEHVIHNRIARAHQWFANGQAPHLERLEKRYREECQEFYRSNQRPSAQTRVDYAPINSCPALPCPALPTTTEQYPEGEDLRNPPPPQPALPINNSEFETWLEPWPRCANPDEAARAWISVMTADQLIPATACRDRYLGSREVADGAVMEPAKFIFAQFKCRWSGKWIAAKNGNGKKSQLDEMAERVLADMEREESEKCQRQ